MHGSALLRVLPLVAVLAALGCAPATHVVAEWNDPTVDVVSAKRPLVVFQHPSDVLRRSVEDWLAHRLPGAVQSYRVLSEDDLGDVEAVREKVEGAGFDSVIIGRVVDAEERVEEVYTPLQPFPMMAYDPFWGGTPYVGYGANAWTYGPTYVPTLDETTVVTLETLVYTLDPRIGAEGGELVFTSRSETFDPRSTKDLAASLLESSLDEMERDGVAVLVNERPPQRAMGR